MKNFINSLLLSLFFVIYPSLSHSSDADLAYQWLQTIRAQTGMVPLSTNSVLTLSAQNHAFYLTTNRTSGHYETSGRTGFTGVSPSDRATTAGYQSRQVLENVSIGSGEYTAQDSIEGLMSAIYHRFGFLDFQIDEIGVGVSQGNGLTGYVYNMGNSQLNALCQGDSFDGFGVYYYGVCQDIHFQVESQSFDQANDFNGKKNPRVVLWPTDQATDVPPAFFEEDPDPLPDFSVSGYPISVQFNPFYVKEVELQSFQLFAPDGTEINDTRLLDQHSDPNQKITDSYSYALFPLKRLAWNSTYTAMATFMVDGTQERYTWTFTTRNPGTPLYTLDQENLTITAPSGQSFVVYIPPKSGQDTLGALSFSYDAGMVLDTHYLDDNTIQFTVTGKEGQKVQVATGNGHRFTVQLNNTTPSPTMGTSEAIKFNLKVNGKEGELITLNQGEWLDLAAEVTGTTQSGELWIQALLNDRTIYWYGKSGRFYKSATPISYQQGAIAPFEATLFHYRPRVPMKLTFTIMMDSLADGKIGAMTTRKNITIMVKKPTQ